MGENKSFHFCYSELTMPERESRKPQELFVPKPVVERGADILDQRDQERATGEGMPEPLFVSTKFRKSLR